MTYEAACANLDEVMIRPAQRRRPCKRQGIFWFMVRAGNEGGEAA